jgi:hypothetical protein
MPPTRAAGAGVGAGRWRAGRRPRRAGVDPLRVRAAGPVRSAHCIMCAQRSGPKRAGACVQRATCMRATRKVQNATRNMQNTTRTTCRAQHAPCRVQRTSAMHARRREARGCDWPPHGTQRTAGPAPAQRRPGAAPHIRPIPQRRRTVARRPPVRAWGTNVRGGGKHSRRRPGRNVLRCSATCCVALQRKVRDEIAAIQVSADRLSVENVKIQAPPPPPCTRTHTPARTPAHTHARTHACAHITCVRPPHSPSHARQPSAP